MLSIKSDSKETYYTHSKKYLRQRNIKVKQIIFLQKMQITVYSGEEGISFCVF